MGSTNQVLGFGFLKSRNSSLLIYLRRCRTVSVGRMFHQYYLKNVQNLTYLVDFFSKTQYFYIYEVNFNV